MPKIEEKQKIVKELEQKLQNACLVVFTDYRGINVEEMTALREKLRVPGVEYRVVKNTLTEFALRNTGLYNACLSNFLACS
jgi:large subunit ribosomal protein L10